MYLGSANLTGAGLGAKADGRRNFEMGIWTESPALIDAVHRAVQRPVGRPPLHDAAAARTSARCRWKSRACSDDPDSQSPAPPLRESLDLYAVATSL